MTDKHIYQDNEAKEAAKVLEICIHQRSKMAGRSALICEKIAIEMEIERGIEPADATGKSVEGSHPWYCDWQEKLKDSDGNSFLPPCTQLSLHRIASEHEENAFNPSKIMRRIKNSPSGEPVQFKHILFKEKVMDYILSEEELIDSAFKSLRNPENARSLAKTINEKFHGPSLNKLLVIIRQHSLALGSHVSEAQRMQLAKQKVRYYDLLLFSLFFLCL